MTTVHHILCGSLQAPQSPRAICHCLLLEDANGLALVDTGIGLLEGRTPDSVLGRELIEEVGFEFNEEETAVREVERLGFRPEDVGHVVLTHCDPDHTGGLADLPHAQVHVSEEELASVRSGRFRYVPKQFEHGPEWNTYPPATRRWLGMEARPVLLGFTSEVLLIPLFGHTLGHCGVAIQQEDGWVLHVGDAYYLRVETGTDDHPVSLLAAQRAEDDAARRASLEHIRRIVHDHPDEVELFGYHDPGEFPPDLT